MIKNHRDVVQRWSMASPRAANGSMPDMDHRMEAAQFVANNYYNQNPRLLSFVLSKPPDRVKYTNLASAQTGFRGNRSARASRPGF